MSEIKYAWRPATKADVGSVARFRRKGGASWEYGILVAIMLDHPEYPSPIFVCSSDSGDDWRSVCEIQYVSDDEP